MRALRPATTRTTLALDLLEAREVPAAYTFSNGLLTVNMAEVVNRSFDMRANSSGVVVINSRATGGPNNFVVGAPNGVLRANQVTAIRVNGSAFDDSINLPEVDARAYRNLSGRVDIDGRGGRDTIRGTAFDDRIRGGDGDDRLFGSLGGDRIWGGDGNDDIYGDGSSAASDRDGGADRIDGGSGNDDIYGGGGADVLIGGVGVDTLRDTGVSGRDVFYVDFADRQPGSGWGSAGAEDWSYGNPPPV